MQNAFYFMSKALFVPKIFTFFSDFLVIQKDGFIRKVRLISKFMTSHTGQQIITINILPNILRSKGNQAMKLGHLIEYTMRNIFLKNHRQNVVEKLAAHPFMKNQN